MLYVVATPIGNLEDITLRALRVLREADLVAAEDTRHTRKLLAHFEIGTPLVAYHAHSPAGATERILDALRGGESVALVTDAGTPGISDPGGALVAAAAAAGFRVVPVPGPSAVAAAVSVSGLVAQRFSFEGFPPRAAGERRRFFAGLAGEERALVFFEAPQRLVGTLAALSDVFGDRPIVVAREVTKQFEEIVRGTARDALAHFRQFPPRGEFVLVVRGAAREARSEPEPACLEQRAGELLEAGRSERDAARELATEQGVPRRVAYAAVLKARER